MRIDYRGKYYLRDGFEAAGLWDYVQNTKARLRLSLQSAPYMTADEQTPLREASRRLANDPYARRTDYYEQIKRIERAVSDVRAVPYNQYPLLYRACLCASRALLGAEPLIYLYDAAEKKQYAYQAFACDYLDNVRVYVSDRFFSQGRMLSYAETVFLVGHELGHAQCHHTTIKLLAGRSDPAMEYSADRAGLIACARDLAREEPQIPAPEIARRAVRAGAALLRKIDLANAALLNKAPAVLDWAAFDYNALSDEIAGIFQGASALPQDAGTHPSYQHRVMAMVHFSQSELFYRCLCLDPKAYANLLSDSQLQNSMGYQL